jgi:hypothetical protein
MNRFLILLFSILFISCCNEKKILNNGLTKKVDKTIVNYIRIERDSLNMKTLDTLSIRESKYNSNDQISNLIQTSLFDNEKLEIEYIYNDINKIKTEVGKMSNVGMFEVHYFYKDTLLIKTQSENKTDIFHFKQIGKYKYKSDKTLKQSSLLSLFIDIKSKDTITNTIEISKYDNKKLISESKLSNFINPERNRTLKYKYKCGELIKELEFNSKDSLISNTEYKYEFDKFKNWIKKELIVNNKKNYIQTREIEYK